MFLVVGLEDYLEREVKNSVAAAVKVLFWVLLLLWPLAAILGAFGNGNSHTWWQWTLAGLGEALWLIIMLAVWASVEGSKNASNTTRSSRRVHVQGRGVRVPRRRSRGAAEG
jgi:hypothetical protein